MNEAGYYHHREFSEDHIRTVRSFYLPFFHDAESVLELGCGRGELLELLRAAGKTVSGVELDERMAEEARAKGIAVTVADARAYLEAATATFDAIIAAHLLEHMTVDDADALVGLAAARLCHGGILCLIVPNAASYPVLSEEFWNDPTHVRPYGHELLAFLTARHGLRTLRRGVNPLDVGGYPVDVEALDQARSVSPLRRLGRPELGHLSHLNRVFDGQRSQAALARAPADVQELWQAMVYVMRGLQAELEDAHGRISELNEQLLYMNHQLSVTGGNVKRLVEILYAPNEYFVICQKGQP